MLALRLVWDQDTSSVRIRLPRLHMVKQQYKPPADVDDDGKLVRRYVNKRVNAAKESIDFVLTFDEFVALFRTAGIVSSMCGNKGYQLARDDDTGPYADWNCGFKTHTENQAEKRITPAVVRASRLNVQKAVLAQASADPAIVSASIKAGQARSGYTALRQQRAVETKQKRNASAHPSYTADKNSQFGSFWITNGVTNVKCPATTSKLPRGFWRGRTIF